jgi:hypothetical protein
LNHIRPVTLSGYLLSFKSISGFLVGLFSAVPILAKFLPESYSGYGFPPLGSVEGAARVATVALALAAVFFAFFTAATSRSGNRKHIAAAIIFSLLCLCSYFALFLRFVRTVDIPSKEISVQVSVGYERTDFAKRNFGTASDEELLRERGISEEEIWKLWTARSVLVARLSLCITYVLAIFSLVTAFGWGVVDQLGSDMPTTAHAANP